MKLATRCVCVMAVAACGHTSANEYAWDDTRVLCSQKVDDITLGTGMGRYDELVDDAVADGTAILVHAHQPGTTVSIAGIEHMLATANERGLELVTYDQLTPSGPGRPAVALAFDDEFIWDWTSIRGLLQQYNARVTFFVTRYAQWPDDEKALLQDLAADGHDIEAHGVNHLNAVDYLEDHTAHDYTVDEIAPSVQVLEDAGYNVTSFAFPFGASNDELDTEALTAVQRVRVGGGSSCPN